MFVSRQLLMEALLESCASIFVSLEGRAHCRGREHPTQKNWPNSSFNMNVGEGLRLPETVGKGFLLSTSEGGNKKDKTSH